MARSILFALVLVAAAVAACPIRSAAQDGSQTEKLSLKTQLEQGLRARRPVEFEFVARVVEKVDKGELPRSVVDGVYGWARKQRRHPFQYFEFALRKQAAKLGVDL